MGLIEFLKSYSLPEWLTKNIVTALGKGIHGIVAEASEIPITRLRNYNEKQKLIGEIQREAIRKAAEHPLRQIESDPELARRALDCYGIKLIEEQLNKESVAAKAIEQIKLIQIPDITPENTLGQDWLTSFWNLAATKSEDEIQEILGKILANEMTRPGSLSTHTLQTLSILDSKVGNAFARLCNISIDDGETAFVIHPHVFSFQNVGDLSEYDISFIDLLYLDGSSLIRSAESIQLNFAKSENLKEGEYDFGTVDYASIPALLDVSDKQLNLIYFTQAGRELRRLIKMTPNEKYTQVIQKKLGGNFKLEI